MPSALAVAWSTTPLTGSDDAVWNRLTARTVTRP